MNIHMETIRRKAAKGLNVLKYAATQHVQQKSLLDLMMATVSSRLGYGLHLGLCASQKAKDTLQRVESEALRMVTGAAIPTLAYALRYWMWIKSVEVSQRLQGGRELMQAATTRSHPLYEELRSRKNERVHQGLVTVRSWVVDSRELVELFAPSGTSLGSRCQNWKEREAESRGREQRLSIHQKLRKFYSGNWWIH